MILFVVVSIEDVVFRTVFKLCPEYVEISKIHSFFSQHMKSESITKYVESLQARGRYTFTKSQAAEAVQGSLSAVKLALNRLAAKKRIARIRRDFYIIIPLEYSSKGVLPPDWFIDPMMAFLGQPYYVGLLSASAVHGSSIQQPQEYQVVIPIFMRSINLKHIRIRFFKRSGMHKSPVKKIKSATGSINVSDPAVTAIDLVGYAKQIGGYDSIVPPINELCKLIAPDMLIEAAEQEQNLAFVQRLGYILEWLGEDKLADRLAKWLAGKKADWIALDPSAKRVGPERSPRWHIIVNTEFRNEP